VKRENIWLALILCLLLAGCSFGPSSVLEPKPLPPESILKQTADESEALTTFQEGLRKNLEKEAPPTADVEPMMPAYDPLEDQIVSFSMVDEDLQLVLYSLAQAVGMNLIIDPNLAEEKRLVTLNLENVSASTVLKEILGTFDLFYEVKQNVIRIQPYEERIFKLNFLDADVEATFDVGGDVLGAGETEQVQGLSGNFKLSGKGAKKSNPYNVLEEMIKGMLSKGGKYSLNTSSGSLYIKDTPAVIRSVSSLINHLRETLARQILIEARIIEVSLSDKYSYGIDWSVLRDQVTSTTKVNYASWSLGRGLVLRGIHNDFSIDAAIDALRAFGDSKVVSNPSIRSKHGRPAIISVGTSFTYKKSVSTTRLDRDAGLEETTDVEVSTVFDGLILGVIPFIEANGQITLLINPIISDVDPDSLSPKAVTASGTESISLPVVSIREISTTIGVKSGDVVVLGGLIDKRRQTSKEGVPFLSAIPGLGYLFKNEASRDETRELVIILSVSMV
jgi:MSHA type pilus biogenesis protein MshL